MYNLLPIWSIAVGFAVLLFVTCEAACWAARKHKVAPSEVPFDIALTPAFTLVALLLGFAFSMALGRYESRTRLVVQEANAVRRVILLSQEPLTGLARQYAAVRVEFARADAEPVQRAEAGRRSDELQRQMWQLAPKGSSAQAALVEAITVSAEHEAAFTDYIPPAVLVMLVLISAISSGLMGFRLGCQGRSGYLAGAMLAVMLALILGTVIDLDQPQRGFIRVNLEPLAALEAVAGPGQKITR